MRKKERFEARKKVSIRVNEPLYKEFKEAVAVRTHKRHGMSDEFEGFIKAYLKSDIGRHDEAEGMSSDEDMTKNTAQFGNLKKNVSSHHEEAIDKESESGTTQRTEQVDVNDVTIALFNWFMEGFREEYNREASFSDFINICIEELWKAKGFIVEHVRTD